MHIEKNIPMNAPKIVTPELKIILESVEIGDSFVVPTEKIRMALPSLARRQGIKIKTKKTEGGFRVWRIA